MVRDRYIITLLQLSILQLATLFNLTAWDLLCKKQLIFALLYSIFHLGAPSMAYIAFAVSSVGISRLLRKTSPKASKHVEL